MPSNNPIPGPACVPVFRTFLALNRTGAGPR